MTEIEVWVTDNPIKSGRQGRRHLGSAPYMIDVIAHCRFCNEAIRRRLYIMVLPNQEEVEVCHGCLDEIQDRILRYHTNITMRIHL